MGQRFWVQGEAGCVSCYTSSLFVFWEGRVVQWHALLLGHCGSVSGPGAQRAARSIVPGVSALLTEVLTDAVSKFVRRQLSWASVEVHGHRVGPGPGSIETGLFRVGHGLLWRPLGLGLGRLGGLGNRVAGIFASDSVLGDHVGRDLVNKILRGGLAQNVSGS